MSGLPAPLTPADCDLRDFQFMPLDVARLRDSDLAALESPEACWAAVLLWSASWHQVPAASLPNDNRILSQLAGYGRVVKEWERVKAGALRGWVQCADGRLYHPVVAEKAMESWGKKVQHHWKKECDRIRKMNKAREAEGKQLLQIPPEPGGRIGECHPEAERIPPEINEIPPEIEEEAAPYKNTSDGIPVENALKGQGQGQGQCKPNTSLDTSNGVGIGNSVSERPIVGRNVEISVLLRAANVKPMTAMHPLAVQWAGNAAITDDLLRAAIETARQYKPNGHISPNYLQPIIAQLLEPPAEAKPKIDYSWRKSNEGIDRMGRELKMQARPSESYQDYARRIDEELERRRRGGTAA